MNELNEQIKPIVEAIVETRQHETHYRGRVEIICTAIPILAKTIEPASPEQLALLVHRFDAELTRLVQEGK